MKKLPLLFAAFMIALASFAAPVITSFSPMSGVVGTLVTVTGTGLSSPTTFTIGGVAAVVVSNTGTSLVGMVMPGASTGSISITTTGGSATSSSSYTVTPALYPSVQQGAKLTAPGSDTAGMGWSTAISADGNTAVVGLRDANNSTGGILIYVRSGGVWALQGPMLVGTGALNAPIPAEQGASVAISADGNTVIEGGWDDNVDTGAAWVFTRSGTSWTQQGAKITGMAASDASGFGKSVALSADGNTAMVGGNADSSSIGAVWVFTRTGGTWTQQGPKLRGSDLQGEPNFGGTVALSADGNTAVIGGAQDSGTAGAIWCYNRAGGVWTQQGPKLRGAGASANAAQGLAVAISADGNTVIEGGPNDNGSFHFGGAAWIYTRTGSVWTQQGPKLVGAGASANAAQGFAVSISADGNTAVVAGNGDRSDTGSVWLYKRSGGVWTQQGSKLIGTGAIGQAFMGTSMALSSDGSTVICGGPLDNSYIGAAWVFVPQTCTAGSSASSLSICQADLPYPWNGITFTTGGTQTAHVITNAGCDSAATLTLSVWPSPTVTFTQTDSVKCTNCSGGPVVLPLTGGSPSGGHYSGAFVAGDSLLIPSFMDSVFSITYTYTDSNGCSGSSAHTFRVYPIEGLFDISGSSIILLYPNPNKGTFTLRTSNSTGATYTVTDMLGKIVMQGSLRSDNELIDMQEARDGVYALTVKGSQPIRFAVLR